MKISTKNISAPRATKFSISDMSAWGGLTVGMAEKCLSSVTNWAIFQKWHVERVCLLLSPYESNRVRRHSWINLAIPCTYIFSLHFCSHVLVAYFHSHILLIRYRTAPITVYICWCWGVYFKFRGHIYLHTICLNMAGTDFRKIQCLHN